MGFSERLKLLRRNADVTQDQLAQYLQVSRSTIAGYETKNRQPDYDKLYMIAQFFHVSTDYLISGKESQPIELSSSAPAANERIIQYQLKTIYMSLSVKSKQDLLEYANLLALRDRQ
nr:helix-turn-helix transcriptional regulator [uncultured Sellimonas sp.]